MEKEFVGVRDVARMLGVKPSWVYSRTRRVASGIPYYRIGKYIKFNLDEVNEWLKQTGGIK